MFPGVFPQNTTSKDTDGPFSFQLCGSEEFWEQAVRRRVNLVSAEVASLALDVGWRRVFFTNKLQLQKLLSRRRLKAEEQQGPSDSEAEEPSIRSSEEEPASDPTHHPEPLTVDSCSDADPDPEGGSASPEVLPEDTHSSEDSDLGL